MISLNLSNSELCTWARQERSSLLTKPCQNSRIFSRITGTFEILIVSYNFCQNIESNWNIFIKYYSWKKLGNGKAQETKERKVMTGIGEYRGWERVFLWAVNGQYLFAREGWLSIQMLREMRIKDVCFVNCDFTLFISIYFRIVIIDIICYNNLYDRSHSIAQE